jgi:hypothetical protein
MKPKLVLLDANVIIEAFRVGVWDRLVGKVEVIIARSVFEDESVHWFVQGTGERKYIDLGRFFKEGKVRIVDGPVSTYSSVRRQVPRTLILHAGELESIAWLMENDEPVSFCTADRAATRALVFLDLTEKAVSLEGLLREHGVSRPTKDTLRSQYLDRTLQNWLHSARIEKLQASH